MNLNKAQAVSRRTVAKNTPEIKELPLGMLISNDKFRTRLRFVDIEALAADIREHGQMSPLIVRPRPDHKYDLIAGNRRLAALKHLHKAAALVSIYENIADARAFCLAVSENVQREDLTALEKALICERLHNEGMSKPRIAKLVFPRYHDPEGRTVSNYLTVAHAPAAIQEPLGQGRIRFSIALFLADAVKSEEHKDYFARRPQAIGEIINRVIIDDLSVRDAKALLANTRRSHSPGRPRGSASGPQSVRRTTSAAASACDDAGKPAPSASESKHDGSDRASPSSMAQQTERAESPLIWRDISIRNWYLAVRFVESALRHNPGTLEEIEERLEEALERVRSFRERIGT